MDPLQNSFVKDYLDRLRSALGGLPAARREEIIEEVVHHITDAWSELPDESEVAIRTMLEHLGGPEDIAADAFDGDEKAPGIGARKFYFRVTRNVLFAAGAAVVIGLIGVIGGIVLVTSSPPHLERHISVTGSQTIITVPDVVGLKAGSASKELSSVGLRLIAQATDATPGEARGVVLRESPSANTQVPAGSTVIVIVSGPSLSSTTTTVNISPTTTSS